MQSIRAIPSLHSYTTSRTVKVSHVPRKSPSVAADRIMNSTSGWACRYMWNAASRTLSKCVSHGVQRRSQLANLSLNYPEAPGVYYPVVRARVSGGEISSTICSRREHSWSPKGSSRCRRFGRVCNLPSTLVRVIGVAYTDVTVCLRIFVCSPPTNFISAGPRITSLSLWCHSCLAPDFPL